jgi:hypothetical protein
MDARRQYNVAVLTTDDPEAGARMALQTMNLMQVSCVLQDTFARRSPGPLFAKNKIPGYVFSFSMLQASLSASVTGPGVNKVCASLASSSAFPGRVSWHRAESL